MIAVGWTVLRGALLAQVVDLIGTDTLALWFAFFCAAITNQVREKAFSDSAAGSRYCFAISTYIYQESGGPLQLKSEDVHLRIVVMISCCIVTYG